MKLTYDELLHIISLTWNAKDSLQLMATCRVLYHEGTKIMLKMPITIYREEQLASFLQFLCAENFSHCRFLRELDLGTFQPESENVQGLIDTLPHLVNIEHLQLSTEELLEPYPTLFPVFSALMSLRRIYIYGAKEVTCELLSSLQSPLISISIDFRLTNDDMKMWDFLDANEWSDYHPMTLLTNFADTLEEIRCKAWLTNQDTVIPTKVYPNMHKLAIENEFLPRIDSFIRAFPNLTDLYYVNTYYDGDDLEEMQESHVTNVVQQLSLTNSCGTWEHLEHFTGSLFDLYTIGLMCRIPRITIECSPVRDDPMMDMLATVLRYARPVHLKLEIAASMLGDADRGFISMLRTASLSDLIDLDFCIYFGEADQKNDVADVIRYVYNNLFLELGHLPLKWLEIRVHTEKLDPAPESAAEAFLRLLYIIETGQPAPPEHIPAPLSRAELSLNALDKDALVVRLAESLTALEVVHVVIFCSRHGGERFEKTITKGTSRSSKRK